LDRFGNFAGERFAGLSLRCRKCDNQIVLAGRYLSGDGNLWFDDATMSGQVLEAGPANDPTTRYALECGRCGTSDQIVTMARLVDLSAALLARCIAEDTPRTDRLDL